MSDRSSGGRGGRRRSRRELLGSLSLFSSLSCGQAETADTVAAGFVRDYYVRHEPALALVVAVAEARARLTAEVAGSEATDPDTRPIIVTRAGKADVQDSGRAVVRYELEVRPRGGTPFVRQATIVLVMDGGSWRVASFVEE